jgi:hypothetical protein
MRAVYTIKDCCGDILDTIEVELPDDISDPMHVDAEYDALAQSKYADPPDCGQCGCRAYRAVYAGYPIPRMRATVRIEAADRGELVETLEGLLRELRGLPDYVSIITCKGNDAVIE